MAKREPRIFDLSALPRLDIKSVGIREVDGEDLIMAAERCASLGGQKVDDNVFGLLLRNQMVAGSIVMVDGERVVGASCQAYMRWTQRTRNFVNQAYDFLNATSEDETELFKKLLTAPSVGEQSMPASSKPTSSASGSESPGT